GAARRWPDDHRLPDGEHGEGRESTGRAAAIGYDASGVRRSHVAANSLSVLRKQGPILRDGCCERDSSFRRGTTSSIRGYGSLAFAGTTAVGMVGPANTSGQVPCITWYLAIYRSRHSQEFDGGIDDPGSAQEGSARDVRAGAAGP